MEPLRLVLYGKPRCPLCDHALAAVAGSGVAHRLALEVVNIEEDAELWEEHWRDIPVLVLEGRPMLKGVVTRERFLERFREVERDLAGGRGEGGAGG